MKSYGKLIGAQVGLYTLFLFAQGDYVPNYDALKKEVDALVQQDLPKESFIGTGVPQAFQDRWTNVLDNVQPYIDFRSSDEALYSADMILTFQNLLTAKDDLLRVLKENALAPQGAVKQKLDEATTMIKDKKFKINKVRVLEIYKQEDVWYLLEQLAQLVSNVFNRGLADAKKISATGARTK